MSASWIPVPCQLWNEVEVVQLAAHLQAERDLIVGKLLRLWSWVAERSGEHHVRGLNQRTIDTVVDFDGFADAMLLVNLLRRADNGDLVVPQFESHLNPASRAKMGEAVRKSISRRREREGGPQPAPEPRPHAVDRPVVMGRPDIRPDRCPDVVPDSRPSRAHPNPIAIAIAAKSNLERPELNCSSNSGAQAIAPAQRTRPDELLRPKTAGLSCKQVELCSMLQGVMVKGQPLYPRGIAASIARHPRATTEQVTWAIERFNEAMKLGNITNPGGYLRKLVEHEQPPNGWTENSRRKQITDISRLYDRVHKPHTSVPYTVSGTASDTNMSVQEENEEADREIEREAEREMEEELEREAEQELDDDWESSEGG